MTHKVLWRWWNEGREDGEASGSPACRRRKGEGGSGVTGIWNDAEKGGGVGGAPTALVAGGDPQEEAGTWRCTGRGEVAGIGFGVAGRGWRGREMLLLAAAWIAVGIAGRRARCPSPDLEAEFCKILGRACCGWSLRAFRVKRSGGRRWYLEKVDGRWVGVHVGGEERRRGLWCCVLAVLVLADAGRGNRESCCG